MVDVRQFSLVEKPRERPGAVCCLLESGRAEVLAAEKKVNQPRRKPVAGTPLLVAVLAVLGLGEPCPAREFRPNRIPNGQVFLCANCHVYPGGPRNLFGQAVEAAIGGIDLDVPIWSSALAAMDSDGDGFTNGQELGDPAGTWVSGQPDPPGPVSNPGDPLNTPNYPPIVTVNYPTNGSTFFNTETLTFAATPSDSDDSIAKVEFFDGSALLGSDTNSPYNITAVLWQTGPHTLRAVATDARGANGTSAPVSITVLVDPGVAPSVSIVERTFTPASLTIKVGGTVTWTHRGSLNCSVTSGANGQYNGLFNSGFFTNGNTFSLTFTSAGNYPYFCLAHGSFQTGGSQRGTVLVERHPSTGLVRASASSALPAQPVTLTFEAAGVVPGVSTPTGTVQFKADGANVEAPAPLANGTASLTTSVLPPGLHTVTAEYAGDTWFNGTTNALAQPLLINTPPLARADTISRTTTNASKVLFTVLLSNDTDADGDPLHWHSLSATSANGGAVTRSGDLVFYIPPQGSTNEDSFTYNIADRYGAQAMGTVLVRLNPAPAPSPNLRVVDLGNGSYRLRFDGIPGRTYRLEYTEDADLLGWQPLASVTASPAGAFEFTDTPAPGAAPRFYRSLNP